MPKFRSYFSADAERGSNFLILDPRESHHLVRVMRARVGDAVEVLDGLGNCFNGLIEHDSSKGARIAVETTESMERLMPEITLVQAVPKGKAMDLILRMATELGATKIQPIFTSQGEVQLSEDRLLSKIDKWKLTMIEATKQCGLLWLPELMEPLHFSKWQETAAKSKDSESPIRLVASLEKGSESLLRTVQGMDGFSRTRIEVLIGPEGDFSNEEYASLKDLECIPVCLGRNVLRAETAAAYLLSVLDQAVRS